MNQKEYLFLCLNSNNIEDKSSILNICQEFKQIHIYSPDSSKYEMIISLLQLKDKKFYLYCFTEKDYLFALKNNITPHICWLNENFNHKSWIDDIVLNYKNRIFNYEFFWMLGEKFANHLNNEEILKISNKLNFYNIPLCFNISNFFNNNYDFIKLHEFIKKVHINFNNPLYAKEFNNINSNEGNYFLNSDLTVEKILMGFFGDIPNKANIELINIKNMNKNKECLNCELYENCTINKTGYFMNHYSLIRCFGPKLMSLY